MDYSLLSQVRLNSPLPSFVELYILRVLNSNMHDAFRLAHQALADSFDLAAIALPYSTGIFYSLWSVLEWKLLRDSEALFGERLMGLRRVMYSGNAGAGGDITQQLGDSETPDAESAALAVAGGSGGVKQSQSVLDGAGTYDNIKTAPLTSSARMLSLLSSTLFPYLRLKLRQWYERLVDQSPDAILERQALERRRPYMVGIHRLLVAMFPYLHAGSEAFSLAVFVAYILERSPHATPVTLLSGIVVRRLNRAEAMSAGGANIASLVFLLVLAAFRVMNFRGAAAGGGSGTAQQGSSSAAVPPPSLDSAAAKIEEPGSCPICRRPIANAAVCVVSGVVACYPCLKQHVDEHRQCPVTAKQCVPSQIRRLYEA
jgi:hypothetical protein